MFKATEIDWTKVPEYIGFIESANAKLLSVHNDPDLHPMVKNARIADIMNSTYFK